MRFPISSALRASQKMLQPSAMASGKRAISTSPVLLESNKKPDSEKPEGMPPWPNAKHPHFVKDSVAPAPVLRKPFLDKEEDPNWTKAKHDYFVKNSFVSAPDSKKPILDEEVDPNWVQRLHEHFVWKTLDLTSAPTPTTTPAPKKTTVSEALLERLNQADARGNTLLAMAAQEGKTELVKALVNVGADVNKANCYNVTPLNKAARHGDPEMIKTLLEAGANPKHMDDFADNALDVANNRGHRDAALAIMEALDKRD